MEVVIKQVLEIGILKEIIFDQQLRTFLLKKKCVLTI